MRSIDGHADDRHSSASSRSWQSQQQHADECTPETASVHNADDTTDRSQEDGPEGAEAMPMEGTVAIDDGKAEKTPVKQPDALPYTIFSRRKVAAVVAVASWYASFSGISSNLYTPAIPTIAVDLNVTPELVNITVTLYLIMQGISPSLWAPLSDIQGRRLVMLITYTLYLGANVGLALTRSYAQLAVLRAVQSSGSASSVAIGAAIVGDVADRADRAGYMAIFNAASLMGTALGPLIGGAIAESVGWRSIFWLLVAYGGAFLILAAFFFPETLRSLVGNGAVEAKGISRCPAYSVWVRKSQIDNTQVLPPPKQFRFTDVLQPIGLLRHLRVFLPVMYLALHYAVWQMCLTVSSTLFAQRYGLNELQIGLTFLSSGGGCVCGTLIAGRLLDKAYQVQLQKVNQRQDGKPLRIAYARLNTLWIYSFLFSASVLVFGWTVDKLVHISVPIICTFFLSASTLSLQVAVQTYLVDIFPAQSASANASLNLSRCLLAAGGTAAILPMTNAMTIGWAFTLLCFVCLFTNFAIFWELHNEKKRESTAANAADRSES